MGYYPTAENANQDQCTDLLEKSNYKQKIQFITPQKRYQRYQHKTKRYYIQEFNQK